jgi:Carboxypeptidase regulatory-like domain
MAIGADFPLLCSANFRAERLFLTERPRGPLWRRLLVWEIRSSYARRIGRCIGVPLVLGGMLMGPSMFVALPTAAIAQAAQRIVQGKVELSSGGVAKGAIVYIKNGKTLEVRTYISTADGSYRFGQLNSDADYTVWAEYQGKKSKAKTISSFDTKKEFNIPLKIDA